MLTVTFDPNRHNFIVAGGKSYFLLQLPDGSRLMINDRCLHRGGPLHLGHWDEQSNCLVCPWHQSKYKENMLRKRAAPMIYRNGQATVILDEMPDAEVRLQKKTILVKPCQNGQHSFGRCE